MGLSIRWKLVLAIGIPLLLISSVAVTLDYLALRAAAYRQMEAYVSQLTQQYAARLDARMEQLAQVGRSTGAFIESHPELTEEAIYDLMRTSVLQSHMIYGACVAFAPYAYDTERRLVAPYVYGDRANLSRMDVADAYDYTEPKWDWYRLAHENEKPYWTEPFFDEGAGDVVMSTYVVPLFRDGEFFGTTNIDVELETLHRTMNIVPMHKSRFSILSKKGVIVSDEEIDLIYNETVFSLAAKLNQPALAALGLHALTEISGTTRLRAIDTGEMMLVGYARVPSTGWSFVAGIPETEILSGIYGHLARRTILVSLSVILILAITVILSLLITRPINRLSQMVQALDVGNLGARAVGINSKDEFGRLARALNSMAERLRDQIVAVRRETAARQAVESELRVAREIQASLLPRRFPPFPERHEFELHAVNAPARHVAGDFFDFFFVSDDQLMLVIADVSGKGIPAAMFMAVARTIVRNLAMQGLSPCELLREANRLLLAEDVTGMFVTMFVARYDTRQGQGVYASAGHPPPCVLSADGHVGLVGPATGLVLGVEENQTYGESPFSLDDGDMLVCYTDGLPEARSPTGDFYRDERLLDLLAMQVDVAPADFCAAIVSRIEEFSGFHLSDDLTLLVLRRRNGVARQAAHVQSAHGHASSPPV